jgi:precorrin-6B methylase 2
MTRCECSGHETTFDTKMAEDDLRRYRSRGPDRPIRQLVEALRSGGVDGATLIDIGGGIGAVPFELLGLGAASAISVDASSAFVTTARAEAERRGVADRIRYVEGDFVDVATKVERADLVTLCRSICCYGDMPALLGAAADRARRSVGVVYPRDTWWSRAGATVFNVVLHVARDGFRFHVHREGEMDRVLRSAGFERRSIARGLIWQVAVYDRAGG